MVWLVVVCLSGSLVAFFFVHRHLGAVYSPSSLSATRQITLMVSPLTARRFERRSPMLMHMARLHKSYKNKMIPSLSPHTVAQIEAGGIP